MPIAAITSFTCLHLPRSRVSHVGLSSLPNLHALPPEISCKLSLFGHGSTAFGAGISFKKSICHSAVNSSSVLGSSSSDNHCTRVVSCSIFLNGSAWLEADQGSDTIPMPIIVIDQDSDSDATIVELSFGDRLGALIDTMKALKDLGLDVTKGTVTTEESAIQTKLFIKHQATGRKIEEPDMLERVRLTIINNLLKYHPECSEQLAMGEVFGVKAPEKKLDVDVATHIQVRDDGPKRSLLYIETADRPGLLMEIIKIMADININVESAEIDTEGLVAKDKFHVSYRGAALNSSLSQVLTNCLRYYLRRPETDEDSY